MPNAIAGTRCPECGFIAESASDWTRPRRRWWAAVLGLTLLLIAGALGLGPRRLQRMALWIMPAWKTTARHDLGAYAVLLREARDPEAFPPRMIEVRQGRDVVWRLRSFYPSLGGVVLDAADVPHEQSTPFDVTGDGTPDLVVTDSSPGSGGFSTSYVFSMQRPQEGPSLAPLAVLPFSGVWKDLDGDGSLEYIGVDRTFDYWWTSGAGSPHQRVIFHWNGDHFEVAASLMRRAPVPAEALRKMVDDDQLVAESVQGGDWVAPPLKRVLDFLYSGNSEQARSYLRLVLPRLLTGERRLPGDALSADQMMDLILRRFQESPFVRALPSPRTPE